MVEMPQREYGTNNVQFWDTIHRADASFHRQDTASRRFHEVKRRVDQTLRRVSGAEDARQQHKHDLVVIGSGDSHYRHVQPLGLDLQDESIAPHEEQRMHDSAMTTSGSGDVSSLQHGIYGKDSTAYAGPCCRNYAGDAESTRQEEQTREAHEQIAPIIDAMESRAARVEQLVEEMERLLIDVQCLLDTTVHQSSSSEGSPLRATIST
jgi:hypothetical protein